MPVPVPTPRGLWYTYRLWSDLFKGTWPEVQKRIQFYLSKYFYKDDLLKAFLFDRDFAELPKNRFIDYARYLNYYASDIKETTLKMGEASKRARLPYQEVINFVEKPNVKIDVVGNITEYVMSQELVNRTDGNLRAFLVEKPKTADDPVLRLASLFESGGAEYKCRLERSTYFFQARTNLTLDYPLDNQDTLRTVDLGPSNNLRSLEDSILLNSIGVSAVVYFDRNGELYFFMKYRRPDEGIFGRMFGTTSGVVTLSRGQPITSLVDYACTEMKREFYWETGLDEDRNRIKRIVPLSFTRELMRGGKPQFFFLIQIDEISESEFGRKFQTSAEGLHEFHDNIIDNNRYSAVLSPEFATNLIYAFQFFQAEKRLATDPILLN